MHVATKRQQLIVNAHRQSPWYHIDKKYRPVFRKRGQEWYVFRISTTEETGYTLQRSQPY